MTAPESPAEVLRKAAEKLLADADRCGDPPGSFFRAVAALLEREASLLDAALEFCVLCGNHVTVCPCPGTPLAVARAVLGESETAAGNTETGDSRG